MSLYTSTHYPRIKPGTHYCRLMRGPLCGPSNVDMVDSVDLCVICETLYCGSAENGSGNYRHLSQTAQCWSGPNELFSIRKIYSFLQRGSCEKVISVETSESGVWSRDISEQVGRVIGSVNMFYQRNNHI